MEWRRLKVWRAVRWLWCFPTVDEGEGMWLFVCVECGEYGFEWRKSRAEWGGSGVVFMIFAEGSQDSVVNHDEQTAAK